MNTKGTVGKSQISVKIPRDRLGSRLILLGIRFLSLDSAWYPLDDAETGLLAGV